MLAIFQYQKLIDHALREDIGTGDLSTMIIPSDLMGQARIYAKENGVVCGIELVEAIFKRVDSRIEIESFINDGQNIEPGTIVMEISGPLAGILQGERTALNFMQHLSGIASITRKMVNIVADLGVKVVDTRKTMPGMRALQKYAVRVGGGYNHRYGLYDAVMLKDNHHAALGGLQNAVMSARKQLGHMVKIEVECETLDQVRKSVECGVDVIMLDNMSIDDMKKAVGIIDNRAIIEASGGITEASIREVAKTGVNIVSIGRLTHSVRALDFSLLVDEMKPSMQKYLDKTKKI